MTLRYEMTVAGLVLCLCSFSAGQAGEQEPGPPIETIELETPPVKELGPAEARAALGRSVSYLLGSQSSEGSWGVAVCEDLNALGFAPDSYYAWHQAASALGALALLRAPVTEQVDQALKKSIEWLCSTRMAHRGADWDVDSTWATLYSFNTLVAAAKSRRFAGTALAEAIRVRGMLLYKDLVLRQSLDGGWAYYDDPPFTRKPTWATSFCTALVLPAMIDAADLKWPVDSKVTARARDLIERCALPNGAYTYSFNLRPRSFGGESINQVPGSLGRTQVCNWALAKAGAERITPQVLRQGLVNFFEHHAFLDMVRMRPIPHEGWFANAGYFYFFGHYYASEVIELLPEGEREPWRRKLRHAVAKTLNQDGACSDFMSSGTQVTASTSFAALALLGGLEIAASVQSEGQQ